MESSQPHEEKEKKKKNSKMFGIAREIYWASGGGAVVAQCGWVSTVCPIRHCDLRGEVRGGLAGKSSVWL